MPIKIYHIQTHIYDYYNGYFLLPYCIFIRNILDLSQQSGYQMEKLQNFVLYILEFTDEGL